MKKVIFTYDSKDIQANRARAGRICNDICDFRGNPLCKVFVGTDWASIRPCTLTVTHRRNCRAAYRPRCPSGRLAQSYRFYSCIPPSEIIVLCIFHDFEDKFSQAVILGIQDVLQLGSIRYT